MRRWSCRIRLAPEPMAGLPGWDDVLVVTSSSGDMGGEPGEFAAALHAFLAEWVGCDAAGVTVEEREVEPRRNAGGGLRVTLRAGGNAVALLGTDGNPVATIHAARGKARLRIASELDATRIEDEGGSDAGAP